MDLFLQNLLLYHINILKYNGSVYIVLKSHNRLLNSDHNETVSIEQFCENRPELLIISSMYGTVELLRLVFAPG